MAWLLLSFVFYAANGLLWKWAVQNETPAILINRRSVFTLLFVLLAYLTTSKRNFHFITHPQFYIIIISCLLGVLGLIFLVSFLKEGSITKLSYYSFLGITINSVLTYTLGHVEITTKMLCSGIVLLIGYFVFVWDESRKIKKKTVPLSQHLVLIAMTVCFSLSTYISWTVLKHFEPLELMITQELTVFVITSIISVFIARKLKINPVSISYKYPIMAMVIMLAVFTGLMGLKQYNPIITSISGVAIPLLTLMAGVVVFREKINTIQIISLVVIIIGEILFV